MAVVAINGLGRIGRAALKIIMNTTELDLVAINDLIPPEGLAYLLAYDTVYGRWDRQVHSHPDMLVISGIRHTVFQKEDPARLPWGDMEVDLVFECSGRFTDREGMEKHLQAGARKVILSAPSRSADVPTVVPGVNNPSPGDPLVSCASCTTNCITPVVEIVGRRIGLQKAMMTTVHSYTASQKIVDGYSKKLRRGRAGAANFIPTSTGAALATTRVLPQFTGKFEGMAVRAPSPAGSLADMVFLTSRPTSVKELNTIFFEEAESDRYRGILGVTSDPIVSSDIIQDPRASVIDLSLTQVTDGDMVKVMSWYDNEWGYASQMIRLALKMI